MRTPEIDRMTTPDGSMPARTAPVGTYVYRIKSTGNSSARFGPCEVCGKHVSEVFIQTEGKIYQPKEMTYYQCNKSLFGHEVCLIQQRR